MSSHRWYLYSDVLWTFESFAAYSVCTSIGVVEIAARKTKILDTMPLRVMLSFKLINQEFKTLHFYTNVYLTGTYKYVSYGKGIIHCKTLKFFICSILRSTWILRKAMSSFYFTPTSLSIKLNTFTFQINRYMDNFLVNNDCISQLCRWITQHFLEISISEVDPGQNYNTCHVNSNQCISLWMGCVIYD